jgi:hypothetical protein
VNVLKTLTKWQTGGGLLILAILFLASLGDLFFFNKPPDVFHPLTKEEAERGCEIAANDNAPFLKELLVQKFGWDKLPANSVQHVWMAGFWRDGRERLVIRLSPEEFDDLKAHIDSYLAKEPRQDSDCEHPFSTDSPGNRFKWWVPPGKTVFSFRLDYASNEINRLFAGYTMEYDPVPQLLYIDAWPN